MRGDDLQGRPDIAIALDKIESERADSRHHACSELRRLLVENRQTATLKQIDDKGYHAVLETVFRIVKLDLSQLAKATKYSTSKVSTRLSASAGLLRTVVEVGVSKLRSRTIKAIIEHIVQCLRAPDGQYHDPLVFDYFKALTTLLNHKAHVEHLTDTEWQEIVDFCLACIRDLGVPKVPGFGDTNSDHASLSWRGSREANKQSSSSGTYASFHQSNGSPEFAFPRLQFSSEDIVSSLKWLVSTSKSPVLSRAKAILDGILNLLRVYQHPTKIQQSSYNVIEQVLSRTNTCDVDLTMQTLKAFVLIIRKSWHRLSQSQRESALAIFLQCEVLLTHMYKDKSSDDEISHLLALLLTLQEQYCARKPRDQLLLDDIRFLVNTDERQRWKNMLGIKSAMIYQGSMKAEETWAVVRVSAILYIILDTHGAQRHRTLGEGDPQPLTKRRKQFSPLEDLLQQLRHQQTHNKIYALQVVSFVLDLHVPSSQFTEALLETLISLLSSEDTSIVNWTLFSLSSLVLQDFAVAPTLQPQWSQVWKLSRYQMGISNSCRIACHVCSILLEHRVIAATSIADVTDNLLTPAALHGPTECDASSIGFWSAVLTIKREESLAADPGLSQAVLRWIFESWNPANTDHFHTEYLSRNNSVPGLMYLFCICLGIKMNSSPVCLLNRPGRLSQAQFIASQNATLSHYLMREHPISKISRKTTNLPEPHAPYLIFSDDNQASIYSPVLEFFGKECAVLSEKIKDPSSQDTNNVTLELIIVVTQLLVICFGILRSPAFHSGQTRSTLRSAEGLRKNLIAILQRHERREDFKNAVFLCLGPLLRPGLSNKSTHDLVTLGLLYLVQNFNQDVWERQHSNAQSEQNGKQEEETMDMEVEFASQKSQQVESTGKLNVIHDESEANISVESLYMSVATHLYCLARCSSSVEEIPATEDMQSLVTYLTSLSREDFLFSKAAIINLIESDLGWLDDDADTILQYIQQVIIKPYELEDSEIAITLCARALTAFTELWTNPTAGDIAATGTELYGWFVQKLDQGKTLSSTSLASIAKLFFKVTKTSPDLARTLSLPSTRTTLLLILSEADIPTKYFIGQRLHKLFDHFILNEHALILEDIIEALPSDPDWPEGIAMRLEILSNLAASWPTLLRRCTYAILETAGRVSLSGAHASICVRRIAKHLDLSSGQELFGLFAPQLIFTWLDTQSLNQLPFAVFGYQTLAHLLRDVQDEILAQCVMRGKSDEIRHIEGVLSKPAHLLLEESFSKVCAYSISRDIAMPPSDDNRASGAERRVRDAMGKTRYAELTRFHFAEIIATIFRRADHEDQIQKAFDRFQSCTDATGIYRSILSLSHSEIDLPPNQQPSFKAKYLLDQIRHVCNRIAHPFEHLWTTSLFVHIFRQLIQTIHPALGSLHTCSVLKKARIMICLAGPTVLKGYPLQMVLHFLRPLLRDTHCADDCIGILRYLFEAGAEQLVRMPSFVLAYTVSTLVDMKEFFRYKQDSTTQSSVFQATMSKAQAYYEWVKSYLAQYEYSHVSQPDTATFKAIVNAACNLGDNGNARPGTHESDLLLAILGEERSKGSMLTLACKKTIMKSIGHDFQRPLSFRTDVLGVDSQSELHADAVLNTCRWNVAGKEYLQWAARVLGRSYASHGMGRTIRIQEMNFSLTISSPRESGTSNLSHSRSRIIEMISDALFSEKRHEVGIAEEALRTIVSKSHSSDSAVEIGHVLDQDIYDAMLFPEQGVTFTRNTRKALPDYALDDLSLPKQNDTAESWIRALCKVLVNRETDDPLMAALRISLEDIEGFSKSVFPFVLHLVLLSERDHGDAVKHKVSNVFTEIFVLCKSGKIAREIAKTLFAALLYLRTQYLPHEGVQADRLGWLDIDLRQAALAAEDCALYETALLLLEIEQSERLKSEGATRYKSRNSGDLVRVLNDALLRIYDHLGDTDAYYGVQQQSTLASVLSRLNHEQLGYRSLCFQSAFFDCELRRSAQNNDLMSGLGRMTQILDEMSLHGLSQTLFRSTPDASSQTLDAVMNSARKLELWSISPPNSYQSDTGDVFSAMRKISNAQGRPQVLEALDTGISACLRRLLQTSSDRANLQKTMAALAILTEVEEIFTSEGCEGLEEVLSRFVQRDSQLEIDSFIPIKTMQSCRETAFVTLAKQAKLRDLLKITQRQAQIFACKSLLFSASTSRKYGSLQDSLSAITYLSSFITDWENLNLYVRAATDLETANVLWSQEETTTSVRMLSDLVKDLDNGSLPDQAIEVSKAGLLAKLGNRTAQARLEKPDYIIDQILQRAVEELEEHTSKDEAGEVFHEFASFCDAQLQNPDSLADFERVRKLRQNKQAEIEDLDRMIESARQNKEKENLEGHRKKAGQWFALDDQDFRRLESSRQTLMNHSLSCYLQALKVSDKYENDALRFSTLWLKNREERSANEIVSQHLPQVPSRKFAALINQWTSRLLDTGDQFQALLFDVIVRICVDHPYHGMYQIFTGSKTKGGKDDIALARHAAACNVVDKIKSISQAQRVWLPIHNMAVAFVRFAQEPMDDSVKPGMKVSLRKSKNGGRMAQDISRFPIPPPTMAVELRADRNYSSVTVIAKFQSEFSTATGISAPKIVTAIGTDGLKYKQLLKSGHDDLRQDAIMEQVFGAVSSLMRLQRTTRQRNLSIRTYKVLPLTATAGIIEFVQNTIPLHDYLLPAHQRHFPKDLKPSTCRKHIQEVQKAPIDRRIKTFQKVCEQFHPVLRYFFQEHFLSPDDWYRNRISYTRSTAAISVLGHILGLGDRHGHNILLDEKTGEVVHIDLGIAFEQGRVLPVPEVVPFRLTRDLVDGMGITGVEGVFRRCCEFTLEALRNESYAIMSILDVLRYDPLYSWSLSPRRLMKMQEAQTENPALKVERGGATKRMEEEAGEAERALLVVSKKLSPTLSVQATVNELIQQATDDKNLAVLFCGWAAYA